MDKDIFFDDLNGVTLKINKEVLTIKTNESQQEIKLNQISGVGIFENKTELKESEKFSKDKGLQGKLTGFSLILFGLVFLTLDLSPGNNLGMIEGSVFVILGIILLYSNFFFKHEVNPLNSYIRLTISGTEKDIKFNKTDKSQVELEKFLEILKEKI
jgi:hypothetical protein